MSVNVFSNHFGILLLLCSCSVTVSWSNHNLHLHRIRGVPLSTDGSVVTAWHQDTRTKARTSNVSLWSLGKYGNEGKSSSASEQARREEEQRRRERSGDVVIGKTSAIPNETDFAISPSSTEQAYLRQASKIEQIIYKETERGLEALKMLRIEEAIESFDKVFELKPTAYLWQAGIAKFYAGDLTGAADIFARNAATYEAKFGCPASEERIWRHACELKLISTMSRSAQREVDERGGLKSILTQIPVKDYTAELLRSENRMVVRLARDLFSASIEGDVSTVILSRARLHGIGGPLSEHNESPIPDRKMWKLTSWFYLGLYYDTLGRKEDSKKCMKMALRLCPCTGLRSDIIHALPFLHMSTRDWFDDDEYVPEAAEIDVKAAVGVTLNGHSTTFASSTIEDPILVEAIRSGIEDLRMLDLQTALRHRSLKVTGSKEELQNRLFESLMGDAALLKRF